MSQDNSRLSGRDRPHILRTRETEEERQNRLRSQRERQRILRQNETTEQRNHRLSQLRQNSRQRNENETQEQREQRLNQLRQNSQQRLENETAEQREQRLNQIRRNSQQSLENESTEQREQRLIDQRERYRRNRRIQAMGNNRPYPRTHNNARGNISNVNRNLSYLGEMTKECLHCKAKFWAKENTYRCCENGKVKLAELQPIQPTIERLIDSNANFLKNIRRYNSVLSFTSLKYTPDNRFSNEGYNYSFSINGQLFHRIGQFYPQNPLNPMGFQLYFYSNEEQVERRLNLYDDLEENILIDLTNLMNNINPFVNQFKAAPEVVERNNNVNDLQIRIIAKPGTNRGTNAVPMCNEIAVLFPGGFRENRDIILQLRDGSLQIINQNHRLYIPLAYPLIFPEGEEGWCCESITENREDGSTPQKHYRFRLQIRTNQDKIHRTGRLFQQYIVDVYTIMEQTRLKFFINNQNKFRTELYSNLMDAIDNDIPVSEIGRRLVLPSSYTNGPRYMIQKYQDAMAIVCKYGKPDIFITMTCNTDWPEIQQNLLNGQTAFDRPDLCARVFEEKFKILKNLIFEKMVLGEVLAHVYVIEFQKRGLPHCHMLLILSNDDKPKDSADYDSIVSAEIPNIETHPEAYETVTKYMIHGPCGQENGYKRCFIEKNGVKSCSKRFPKEFLEETQTNSDGYPLYRRRNRFIYMKNGKRIDDRWVVPHNLYLCTYLNCHINVEICSTVSAVKYLYKYVYKGHDKADIQVSDRNDEIKTHLECRYVSATEGFWRINGGELNNNSPHVYHLAIHLEGEQNVTFNPLNPNMPILRNTRTSEENPDFDSNDTTLTAWMKFNSNLNNPNESRQVLYPDFPEGHVYANHRWKIRKQKRVIGRIYSVSPQKREKYFLRLMLYHIRGAKSFSDLRTVDGIVYPSFELAAAQLGLLDNDDEWERCLTQATNFRFANRIRELFVVILTFCSPSNPLNLWTKFKENLIEDYKFHFNEEISIQKDLKDIDELLSHHSMSLSTHFKDLPQIDNTIIIDEIPRIINDEYIAAEERQVLLDEINNNQSLLNPSQSQAYNAILNALNSNSNLIKKQFFIDGPGGSGKTFLYRLLLSKIRSEGEIALAVASSGIAALLLPKGRTAHSRFGIPLIINENSISNISMQSSRAEVIRQAK